MEDIINNEMIPSEDLYLHLAPPVFQVFGHIAGVPRAHCHNAYMLCYGVKIYDFINIADR